MTKKQQEAPPERGCWLTGWLILMLIHGIISSLLVFYLRNQAGGDSPIWLGLLLLVSIAIIVATVAIWYWQRWGLILYAVSIGILPLAILGYLIKDKWAAFGIGTE
jgi:hypothetical protein